VLGGNIYRRQILSIYIYFGRRNWVCNGSRL